MKALTIRQPWAWLILHAGKDIENRPQGTVHRGPLLIHAGKVRPEYDEIAAIEHQFAVKIPALYDLPYGGIVGMVNVVECVRHSASRWFEGPVGWVLGEPRPLPFVPTRGYLHVFDAPDDVMETLAPHLAAERRKPTPDTRCAVCGAPPLDGLIYDSSAQRWLCIAHSPLPAAKCGCTREQAYSHTPHGGFRCSHGQKV